MSAVATNTALIHGYEWRWRRKLMGSALHAGLPPVISDQGGEARQKSVLAPIHAQNLRVLPGRPCVARRRRRACSGTSWKAPHARRGMASAPVQVQGPSPRTDGEDAMPLFPPTLPLRSGTLPEEDGHHVFWETFGTPSRPAMLLLHGGPGGGVQARMPRLFDPERWHVVATDQRGAGRSWPHAGEDVAALRANTTAHLVHDLERLRREIGVERWHLYGSSWGATLAQAYAQSHPGRVAGLILASVTSTSRVQRSRCASSAAKLSKARPATALRFT